MEAAVALSMQELHPAEQPMSSSVQTVLTQSRFSGLSDTYEPARRSKDLAAASPSMSHPSSPAQAPSHVHERADPFVDLILAAEEEEMLGAFELGATSRSALCTGASPCTRQPLPHRLLLQDGPHHNATHHQGQGNSHLHSPGQGSYDSAGLNLLRFPAAKDTASCVPEHPDSPPIQEGQLPEVTAVNMGDNRHATALPGREGSLTGNSAEVAVAHSPLSSRSGLSSCSKGGHMPPLQAATSACQETLIPAGGLDPLQLPNSTSPMSASAVQQSRDPNKESQSEGSHAPAIEACPEGPAVSRPLQGPEASSASLDAEDGGPASHEGVASRAESLSAVQQGEITPQHDAEDTSLTVPSAPGIPQENGDRADMPEHPAIVGADGSKAACTSQELGVILHQSTCVLPDSRELVALASPRGSGFPCQAGSSGKGQILSRSACQSTTGDLTAPGSVPHVQDMTAEAGENSFLGQVWF